MHRAKPKRRPLRKRSLKSRFAGDFLFVTMERDELRRERDNARAELAEALGYWQHRIDEVTAKLDVRFVCAQAAARIEIWNLRRALAELLALFDRFGEGPWVRSRADVLAKLTEIRALVAGFPAPQPSDNGEKPNGERTLFP